MAISAAVIGGLAAAATTGTQIVMSQKTAKKQKEEAERKQAEQRALLDRNRREKETIEKATKARDAEATRIGRAQGKSEGRAGTVGPGAGTGGTPLGGVNNTSAQTFAKTLLGM